MVFVALLFLTDLFRNFGPSGRWGTPFLAPSPMGYPIFGRCLDPIWCQLGAILGHFGARAGPEWAGGVTRSVKNLHALLDGASEFDRRTGS